ncbi:FtsW/RodA/SpoVE family cell cycle protein [Clostridium guangxiense]|uniref:FtsW/RodA/SpoVE family cell cycle protein n=1 Tax=Clostridium guangxiense TaxID=1662055 RepID=UPI001E2A018E|nr:FtsW/RodA/SpoVE family cell cycle protein [Clostridium guangxiense]MCD2348626.1 rod shape-determining protein RodA [Clostridium guangxiense]
MKSFLLKIPTKLRFLKNLDISFIINAVIIVAFGILNIYTSTYYSNSYFFAKRQILWLIASLILCIFLVFIDYKTILRYSEILYWLMIIVLIATLKAPAVKGAHSWLLGTEPAEFAKITLTIALARKIELMEGKVNNFKNFIILSVYILIPFFLIYKQPNLGMSIVCLCIGLGILFISNFSLKAIFGFIIAAIPTCAAILYCGLLKPYQLARITSLFSSDASDSDSLYQVTQSLTAIGSGGTFGKGFLKSNFASNGYIPEIHTDFIFASVGEEWGLVGAIFLFTLYFIFLYKIIKVAKTTKDISGKLICIGLFSSFIFSIFQNVGMTIKVTPVSGITLPFMSYGGSSLLANFIALSLILNVQVRRSTYHF